MSRVTLGFAVKAGLGAVHASGRRWPGGLACFVHPSSPAGASIGAESPSPARTVRFESSRVMSRRRQGRSDRCLAVTPIALSRAGGGAIVSAGDGGSIGGRLRIHCGALAAIDGALRAAALGSYSATSCCALYFSDDDYCIARVAVFVDALAV